MKQDISTRQTAVQILDCLCSESWVIPSPASAANLKPTRRPAKLTGQTQAPRDRTFPMWRLSEDT
jgi:hypothetical protein